MYILGYLPLSNCVYLADKDNAIVSYKLHLSVLEYQTAVLRGDLETANAVLPRIPEKDRQRVADFLEKQNYREEALQVSADPNHRFTLALALGVSASYGQNLFGVIYAAVRAHE